MNTAPRSHRRHLAGFAFATLLGISTAGPASAAGPVNAPTAKVVDVAGVRMFLQLTALLERDEEPTAGQWAALFATPGYVALTRSEYRKEDFIERFKVAFMPSRAADLATQLKRDKRYLPHYIKAKEMRREIEEWASQVESANFEDAVARARSLLPGAASIRETPLIAFVIFDADGRGYDPIVMDILFWNTMPDKLETAAHEFHHWYRRRLAPDLDRDAETLWIINQVNLEGVADQINVPLWIHKPVDTLSARDRQYLESYRRSAAIIRDMDRLLSQMRNEPARRRELGAELRKSVPNVGHPTGYYMAETITRVLGAEALAKTATNAFDFFRAYDKAARKEKGEAPPFSRPALDFLASLEKRYVDK